MGFELNVSVRRDPRERHLTVAAAKASCTEITLNGTFDNSAANAILERVKLLSGNGADSIIIVMEDVIATDAVCLQTFAANLMSLRSAEAHVQVFVRDAALRSDLASIATSRDWLLDSNAVIGSGRRALHFDRPQDDTA